jgi:hypothetical protein
MWYDVGMAKTIIDRTMELRGWRRANPDADIDGDTQVFRFDSQLAERNRGAAAMLDIMAEAPPTAAAAPVADHVAAPRRPSA